MKKLIGPIFEFFFIILALSLCFSMKNSSQLRQQNQEHLKQIQAENRQLQLEQAALEQKYALSSKPETLERDLRELNLVRLPGEDNLELADFVFQPTEIPQPSASDSAPIDEWRDLLFW